MSKGYRIRRDKLSRGRGGQPCVARALSLLVLANLFLNGCSALSSTPPFNSTRAYDLLRKQCSFGPRPVGSQAHDKLKAYLVAELRKHAERVFAQDFRHTRSGTTYDLSNIIARFGPSEGRGVLLCAHWDTRPTADEELDTDERARPIVGANDGASGVAVLLELARMFSDRPPPVPVTIVLFDGEDFGPTDDDMFLGSKHFASKLDRPSTFKYGILLDMVGDKELQIYRESHSDVSAREVVDKVWAAARKLGHGRVFVDTVKYAIRDDHLPLLRHGVPCIDVIDFDYAYWHTLEDTPDKCSAESLRIVGETVAQVVRSERPSAPD